MSLNNNKRQKEKILKKKKLYKLHIHAAQSMLATTYGGFDWVFRRHLYTLSMHIFHFFLPFPVFNQKLINLFGCLVNGHTKNTYIHTHICICGWSRKPGILINTCVSENPVLQQQQTIEYLQQQICKKKKFTTTTTVGRKRAFCMNMASH